MIRRLFIGLGYLAIIIAIIVATVLLVANGRGYSYNFKTHSLVRNGLVIFESTPSGAQITQSGQSVLRHTPYRTTLEAGTYHFEISKPGYRTWSKTLQILASQVTFAQYVLLIPSSPNLDSLTTTTGITASAISRDHRHLAYIGDTDGAVYTIDTSSRQSARIYVPHTPAGATEPETLTGVDWSDDASHLLITAKANLPAGLQTITYVEAANGGDPINLTTQYGFDFPDIKFAPGAWQQLYWISPEGLRRVDLAAQSVSAVLAPDVKQLSVTTDRVLYVRQTNLGKALWSLDRNGHPQEVIQTLADSPSYAVSASSYRGQDYLAVVPSSTHVATLYSGIYGGSPVSQVISHAAADVAFSPDGHYLTLWQGAAASTYDVDRSTLGQTAVIYNFNFPTPISRLSWLDPSHLVTIADGRLIVSEFDGANLTDVASANDSISPVGVVSVHDILFSRSSGTKIQVDELELR